MTTEELSGEIQVVGKSGRNYVFGFGWSCRYNLEKMYGGSLEGYFKEEFGRSLAKMLQAGLRTRPANQIPDNFTDEQMYALLDDLGEEKVKQVYEVAKYSMGFIDRLLGLSTEDVEKLTQLATQLQSQEKEESINQQTGTDI